MGFGIYFFSTSITAPYNEKDVKNNINDIAFRQSNYLIFYTNKKFFAKTLSDLRVSLNDPEWFCTADFSKPNPTEHYGYYYLIVSLEKHPKGFAIIAIPANNKTFAYMYIVEKFSTDLNDILGKDIIVITDMSDISALKEFVLQKKIIPSHFIENIKRKGHRKNEN